MDISAQTVSLVKKHVNKSLFYDVLCICILLFLSLFLCSFLLSAHYLSTGYEDWMVQAFRIKLLANFGLNSWTHIWSNGISSWKTYQFIPHTITLIISWIFHVDIPRAMVIATISQFVLIRILIYTTLRLASFNHISAFFCAILSFDIAGYWSGVGDFSLLFGYTIFPVMIYLWTLYYKNKIQLLFPYLIGLTFYIHPLVGIYTFSLWILGILFSRKKIISRNHLQQFIIFLISSSIFWIPIIIKQSYVYSTTIFTNKYFLAMQIGKYDYFGLSIFLILCVIFSVIKMLTPIRKEIQWVKIIYSFSVIWLILVVLAISITLPHFLSQLQFTRGVPLVGISIIYAFAPVIEYASQIKSSLIKGIIIMSLCLIFIEGLWFTSIYSPQPANKDFEEPVSSFIHIHKNMDVSNNHVWASAISLSSYYAPLSIHLPYSYMGQFESNQIPSRISPLLLYSPIQDKIPQANLSRIDDYYKITGTKYIFLDETSAFTTAYKDNSTENYIDLGQIQLPHSLYHAFQVPWEIRNAVNINSQYKNNMNHFPFNLEFSQVNDQIALDNYVKKFVSLLYQPNNTTLQVTYPTQESIAVKLPGNLTSNLVYIDESYDSSWKATLNNEVEKIQPTGPNFMLVTLKSIQSGTLILTHSWPLSFYISIYLIILTPLLIGVNFGLQKFVFMRGK